MEIEIAVPESLLSAMLKREGNAAHQEAIAKAEEAERALVTAEERLRRAITTLEHAPLTGDTEKVDAAVKEKAAADYALQAARWHIRNLHGDYKEDSNNPAPLIEDTAPPESQVAPAQTPPPVVIEQAIGAGRKRGSNLRAKRKTWRDIAFDYVVEIYRTGKYRTAHVFYVALVNKAGGENSPFSLHDRELFLVEIGQSVAEQTIANAMPEIKAAALQA